VEHVRSAYVWQQDKVEDIPHLIETLREWVEEEPQLLTMLARVMPVTQTFTFQTVEEFEAKARAVETVDGQAGLSLWSRADMQRYPFLGRINGQWSPRRYVPEMRGGRCKTRQMSDS
jgi:hypothetical protein